MHQRQIFILNGVLTVVAFLLAWRLAADWKEFDRRYAAPSATRTKPALIFPPGLPPVLAPAANEIAAKNLFSADRNDAVVQEKKAQQAPPAPVVFGTMNLGGSYEALMSEGGSFTKPFHRVKKGEEIGGYKVTDISDEKVIVEFDGQSSTINVYQSANSVQPLEVRAAPAATPVVESGSSPAPEAVQSAQQPASPASNGQSGTDASVKVTIEGNRRRMERPTPFGPQVWYENIPK